MTNRWFDPFDPKNEPDLHPMKFWYKNGVCKGEQPVKSNTIYEVYVAGGSLRIATIPVRGVIGTLYIDTLHPPEDLGKANFVPSRTTPYRLTVPEVRLKRRDEIVARVANGQAFFDLDNIIALVERATGKEQFTFGIKL